jgi:hypothetical protein
MAKANTGTISQISPLAEATARLEDARMAFGAFLGLMAQGEAEVSLEPRKLYYLLRPIGMELDCAAEELASMGGDHG